MIEHLGQHITSYINRARHAVLAGCGLIVPLLSGMYHNVETLGYYPSCLREANRSTLRWCGLAEVEAKDLLRPESGGKVPPSTAGETPAATNLVLGLLLPSAEPQALSVRQGALLAVQDCTNNGRTTAHLVIRGAVGQWGTDAVEAARMVTDDGAQGLIAPLDGAGSHLALQVSGRTATPVVSLCSDSSVTRTGVRWMVRITPRTGDEAKAIFSGLTSTTKTWMACVPGGRRGQEIVRDISEAAQASKISWQKPIEVKWPIIDLNLFTSRLLTNRADAILLWLDPIPAASLLQSLRAAGFNGRVAGPSWLRCSDFENLAGSAMKNFVTANLVRDDETGTRFERFASDFRSQFSREPDTAAAMSYDGAQLLLQLLSGAKGRPARELFPLNGSFQGVTGVLCFDSLGNRKVELELREGRDAKILPPEGGQ